MTVNPNAFNVRDAALSNETALGNGNAAVVPAPKFDLQSLASPAGAMLAPCELLLEAPALNTTQLPDAATITYTVETDSDSAFGSPLIVSTLGVQTGASAAGAAAMTKRWRPPTDVERYVRVKATNSATVGDASGAKFTTSIVV